MTNEVLFELWTTKDNIAKEHDYDIDSLAAYYRHKQDKVASSTGTRTEIEDRQRFVDFSDSSV